ncbi:hypothetical protein BKA80DRAFT_286237 [Phyllosticta citrichinensis]
MHCTLRAQPQRREKKKYVPSSVASMHVSKPPCCMYTCRCKYNANAHAMQCAAVPFVSFQAVRISYRTFVPSYLPSQPQRCSASLRAETEAKQAPRVDQPPQKTQFERTRFLSHVDFFIRGNSNHSSHQSVQIYKWLVDHARSNRFSCSLLPMHTTADAPPPLLSKIFLC